LLWYASRGSAPGPSGIDYGLIPGGRVAAGLTDGAGDLAVEASGLLLGRKSAEACAARVQAWGGEANVMGNACANPRVGIDLLGGFRYLALEEDLSLAESARTHNQFYGGQLGSQMEVRWGRLYTNLLGKVAVGNMHQIVDLRADASSANAAGLLAAPGNGRQASDEFCVVPEVDLNIGYQIRPGIRLYAGYSFLYLSDVARPGDAATVAPGSQPGGTLGSALQPASGLNHSDFWAQGLNFGLALRY
jgi:hypothetical protein